MDQNSKPQETRPFSILHAKAGAPYACRDGTKAEVLKWDAKGQFSLIGFTELGGSETPDNWTAAGCRTVRGEHPLDLVMIPLGYIEGKPVFTDDKIINPYGDTVSVPAYSRDFENCRWPAPEKQYPTTRMTRRDFSHVLAGPADYPRCVLVANAALHHAIDNGHVIALDRYDKKVNEAYEQGIQDTKSDRAARDMAVAEAVRDWCVGEASDAPNLPTFCNIMRRRDLAAIISKVPYD
jgi:hypothetical protein